MKDEIRSPMSVTCAWCRDVIVAGAPPVSHGLCQSCEPGVLADIESVGVRKKATVAIPAPG